MKVKSTATISFPKLNWSIREGETKELPEDKAAQKRILSESDISVVEGKSEAKIINNKNK